MNVEESIELKGFPADKRIKVKLNDKFTFSGEIRSKNGLKVVNLVVNGNNTRFRKEISTDIFKLSEYVFDTNDPLFNRPGDYTVELWAKDGNDKTYNLARTTIEVFGPMVSNFPSGKTVSVQLGDKYSFKGVITSQNNLQVINLVITDVTNTKLRKEISSKTFNIGSMTFDTNDPLFNEPRVYNVELWVRDGNGYTYMLDNMKIKVEGSIDLSICTNSNLGMDDSVIGGNLDLYIGSMKDLYIRKNYNNGKQLEIIAPGHPEWKNAKWETSNASVVSVSGNTIKANKVGSAVITVTFNGKKSTLNVTSRIDPTAKAKAAGGFLRELCNRGEAEVLYKADIDGKLYQVVRIKWGSIKSIPGTMNFELVKREKAVDTFRAHGYYFMDLNDRLVTDPATIRDLEIIQSANFEYQLIRTMLKNSGQDPLASMLDSIQKTRKYYSKIDFWKGTLELTSSAFANSILAFATGGSSVVATAGKTVVDFAVDKFKDPKLFVHFLANCIYNINEKNVKRLQDYHRTLGDKGYIAKLKDATEYIECTAFAATFVPTMNFDGEFGGYYEDYTLGDWFEDGIMSVIGGIVEAKKLEKLNISVDEWLMKVAAFEKALNEGKDLLEKVTEIFGAYEQFNTWVKWVKNILNNASEELNPSLNKSHTYILLNSF